MKCPHCGKDIKESLITQEAARIAGRKSRRRLDTDTARELQRKSVEKRRDRDG